MSLALFVVGEAFFRLGDYAEAERNYEQALQLKADHIPAYLTMAKLFQARVSSPLRSI